MILIQQSPKSLTANQLSDIINKYDWGFRTNITSKKISKVLSYEISRKENHFMNMIKKEYDGKYMRYYY